MQTVLVIDDNATHRLIHRRWIEALAPEFRVTEAADAASGVEIIARDAPACVLLDFLMAGGDGLQTLHRLRQGTADGPPVIFLTCALTEELRRNALALGAAACFDKSRVSGEALVRAIRTAIKGSTA